MTFSVHDNLLVSYEVQCDTRTITLRTEFRAPEKPTEFTNVIFAGVQGYSLKNDAFGNVIFSLEAIPVEDLLKECGAEISQSYQMAGSPGPWAANLNLGVEYLRAREIKGFILSSSCGLSGWILAREMSVLRVGGNVPATHLTAP